MTPRQRRLVKDSFPIVREMGGPVSKLFYGRLFELQPETRLMFGQDIGKQGLKLIDMLAAVVANIDCLESLNPVLRELGKRHVGYGVLPHHYDTVEQALLWSLRHAMDGEFDDEHRAAWRAVIAKVSAVMKAGAADYSVAGS